MNVKRHSVLVALLMAAAGAHGADYYVATNGSDTASGISTGEPFRTIQRALNVVQPGDTVHVRNGVYREQLLMRRSGTEDQPITIQGYQSERPLVTGAEVVTNWVLHSGALWKVTNWVSGTQQVFVDGAPLRQVGWPNVFIRANSYIYTAQGGSTADMTNGTFFCDVSNRVLYAWLADSASPSGRTIEVSVRPLLLYSGVTNRSLIVRGVDFRQCNSVGVFATGLPGVRLGTDSLLEECSIQWMDGAGISVLEDSTVLRCDVSHNGFIGLGWASCTNTRIAASTILSNNYRNFNDAWHGGGIKVIPALNEFGGGVAGGIVESNEVAWNHGSGIWFDSCTGRAPIIVRGNFVHHNRPTPGMGTFPAGIFMEVVKGALVERNVVMSNESAGIWVAASDNVKVRHNTLIGNLGYNDIRIADIPRAISPQYGIWATLVSNEVVNNVLIDSKCLFTISLPFDSAAATNFAQGNHADYNVYYQTGTPYRFAVVGVTNWTSFADWTNGTPWDRHSLVTAPLLGSNFTPQAGSAVIDSATGLAAFVDFHGVPGPLDGNLDSLAAADRGAIEYVHPMADTDADGLVDTNEIATGTDATLPDTDGDHVGDGSERSAGTDPLDVRSFFAARGMAGDSAGIVVRWSSVTGRTYNVSHAAEIDGPFHSLATNVPATPPMNALTDAPPDTIGRFYRMQVNP
jgi:parallel beta-helix repeat protein